ncbi:MAG: NAD(P) transhydrogenase subunit alpha [Gammaproteobacteria bacterium]|nr:MAG: NAD(P) transhydrogenase subunit alpha [Gammaproteobacteria bacterium]
MKIFFPKEQNNETRIAIVPLVVKKYVGLGAEVLIESGAGKSINIDDKDYAEAGGIITKNRLDTLSNADIICRLNAPPVEEIPVLKKDCIHISFLDPIKEKSLVDAFVEASVTSISMELIPRITRAQKMDALSSQASLGGYSAVIEAAKRLGKVFPMMMTPAGTISPAKVFIVGVGVAGLQAIATAKRLGARVEAFDTRPVVEEQVLSLGAKFIKIDIGASEETEQGYAKELTAEQLELQRQGMIKACSNSDVIITTAQVFGRPAPRIITQDMIAVMKSGSVIVDMAVSTGGNVEGSVLGETVISNGVQIVGMNNLPAEVAENASQVYANNIYNIIDECWDQEKAVVNIDLEDEILSGCIVSYAGELVNAFVKKGD